MKICLIANALAVHTQRWAQALAERGHEVTVLSIRQANIAGVRVISKNFGPVNATSRIWSLLSYLRLALSARRTLARLKPDVVNAHYCITHGSIARFSGARPAVVNLWGSDVLGKGRNSIPWWHRALLRYALNTPDLVVSTSKYMAEAANALLKRPRAISIVPFGVDTARFYPLSNECEASASLPRVMTVGFVKTFQGVYAPDVFLRAAAKVLQENTSVRFVMAGRGPLLDSCRKLAEELGIASFVEFTGFVPHTELPELMRSLDVLVNCSRSESFGVVICEGSSCGLPVIATDVGGVREVLMDGETGILVPKDNPNAIAQAILRLAGDTDLRRRYGKAGRLMVEERYEWQRNVERFEAGLLKEVRDGCAKA